MLLHAEFVPADEDVAVVGSSNTDIRSFALDHGVHLMVVDPGFRTGRQDVVQSYHEDSHELDPNSWPARPRHQEYLDNVARLTSALQ
ncbi:hypothetical protein RCG67_07370 [Kocuria sp. CPCC 205292]|uniref:hypothetical protein n=1 Tax=Kocuria cellulosilytica TaxID=3071451 RepID=UPI0034D57C38